MANSKSKKVIVKELALKMDADEETANRWFAFMATAWQKRVGFV